MIQDSAMNRLNPFLRESCVNVERQDKLRHKPLLKTELLEERQLLSVTSELIGDQLAIQIVPDDQQWIAYIRKQGDGIEVSDNAAFSGAVSYQASQVNAVSVFGSNAAESLVLACGSISASLIANMVDSVAFSGGGSFSGSIGIINSNAATSLSNLFSSNGLIATNVSSGGLRLSGQIVAAQGVSLNADVVLVTDVTIDGGAGSVIFADSVDAASPGKQSLVVTSPANTEFQGNVGGKAALKSIRTQSVTPLDAPILSGNSTTLPIYYLPQNDGSSMPGIKYGIQVAVGDNNPARMYLFDTGGPAFWAAYDENSINGVNISNQTVQNLYTSGLFYNGYVTSANVTIGTGPNAVSTSQPVNFATWKQGGNTGNPDSWFSPPLSNQTGTLYGDFGTSFAINNDVANSPLTSILFQLPGNYSSGYIVRLGAVGGPACLTIGVTDEQRQQFPYAIPLTELANNTYPVSNRQAYEAFAFSPEYIISNGTLTYNLGNLPTISDTGAPSTSIRYPFQPPGFPANFPFTDASGNIDPGTILSASLPTEPGYPALSWTQLIGTQQSVNKAGYMDRTGAAIDVNNVNTGLNLFNQYDVMFDTEKGALRLRPNAGMGTVTIGSVITTGDQNFTQNVNIGGTSKATSGSLNFGGKLYLTGDVSLTTDLQPITFHNTIDGDNGLTIQTNSTVTFGSNVGVYEKLKQISVSAGKTIMPLVSAPTVASFGPQTYAGNTFLNGTIESTDSQIEFQDKVTLAGPSSIISEKSSIIFRSRVNGNNPLSLTAANNITLFDLIGDETPVAGLTVNAPLVKALNQVNLSGDAENAQPDGLVINSDTTVQMTVAGSRISRFSGNGIVFNGNSRNSEISGFTISSNVDHGILFNEPDGNHSDLSGAIVSNNTIIGNNGFGVQFSAPVAGLSLINNRIGTAGSINPWGFVTDGGNTHGIVIGPGDYDGSTISYNTIRYNRGDGIYAPRGVTSLSITDNNISNNLENGIEFFTGDFTGTVISQNNINHNTRNGISLGAGVIPPAPGGDPRIGYTGAYANSGHYVLDYSTSPLVNGLVKNDPKIAIDCPIFSNISDPDSTTVEIPLDTGSRGLYLAISQIKSGTDLGNQTGYVYLNSSNRIFYGNWVNQTVSFPDSGYVDRDNNVDNNRKATANLPVLVVTAIGATSNPAPGSTIAETTFETTVSSGVIRITNGTLSRFVPIVNSIVTIPGGWWANFSENITKEGNYKLPNVCNFGIGFDRTGQGTSPTNDSVNQGYNAFLNLTEMQSGLMRAGYVITPDNIILGLDKSVSDYSYTNLTPTGHSQGVENPPDWQPATGVLTYGSTPYFTGPIVIDMGIPSGIITLPGQTVTSPFDQQLTVSLLNSGGELSYHINYNNANNQLNPSTVSFFNPLAGNYSQNAPRQNSQFFNTGRYLFSAFNYLYDATGGYLGLKPINKSVLESANANYPASGKYFPNAQAPTGVTNLTIGGDISSAGNNISNNLGYGVYINGAGSLGDLVSNNIISGNDLDGIRLTGEANAGQLPPVLDSSSGYTENQTVFVSGTMPKDHKYNGNYIIQFFAGDSNRSGQPFNASVLLGSIVQPAGDFHTSFQLNQNLFGKYVIATSTPQAGPRNTSEFSLGSMINSILVTSSADSGLGTMRNAMAFGNEFAFPKTITYQMPKDDNKIVLRTQLPAIISPMEIDGRNHDINSDYINNVWIDGSKLEKNKSGLTIESTGIGSIIRSMGFRSFRRGNAITVKANDIEIRDNRFHESLIAINLNHSAGAKVINNTITRSGYGVYARGNLSGSVIDSNQINYSHYAGIYLENATGVAVGLPGTGNDICGTETYYSNSAGILAKGVLTGTKIQWNRILSGSNGIIMQNARGLLVGASVNSPESGGNSINKNKRVGLLASGNSRGSVVRNNIISNNHRNVSVGQAKNLIYIGDTKKS
jgi:hypothetical protein